MSAPIPDSCACVLRCSTHEAAGELLHAVYVAHGMLARQLESDGMAPAYWYDDEHEAFRVLEAAIQHAEGK